MDIDTIKTLRDQLEKEINQKLRDFEKLTKTEIYVSYGQRIAHPDIPKTVNITISV